MHDQLTFESRLADAYRRYLNVMPTTIDASAVAARAVQRGRSTPAGLPWRGDADAVLRLRLLLVAGLVVVTVAAIALVAGTPDPVVLPPSATSSPSPRSTLAATLAPVTSYEGRFVSGGSLDPNLAIEALIQLDDGRVLGLGDSWPDARQQSLWDPATQQFSPAGLLTARRQGPVAVRMLDGRVLIVGGDTTEPDQNGTGEATYSTAEIYDPRQSMFTPVGPMVGKGWAPTAVLLEDGRVLVLDGISVDDPYGDSLATAEIFDPMTGGFTATGSMALGRGGPHPAVLLRDGRVLVLGGRFPETGTAELFDPTTGTFANAGDLPKLGPNPVGGTYWPEVAGAAAMLPDGRVLVAGRGCDESHSITPNGYSEGWYPTDASIFDPATDSFTPTASMPHCISQAYSLPNGQVLLTSFWSTRGSEVDPEIEIQVAWSGLYDPATGAVRDTDAPPGGRHQTRILPLRDGRVLFIGSRGDSTVVELYH